MATKKPLAIGTSAITEVSPATDTLDSKIQVSATSRLLGRITAGAGAHEELTASDVISLISSGSSSLSGVKFLLSSDETDSSEYNTSTAESSALKTYNLAANSYSYILIEAIVQARVEQDAATKADFTWRIKSGGTTQKTFVQRIIAQSTAGIDSGGRYVETISTIIAGGQGSTTALTITVQPNLNNAATGGLVQAFRVYGVKDVSFPAIGSVEIAKAGTLIGTRPRVNFIEGTNVTMTIADNSGSGRVDVTINASGGSPSVITPSQITSDQNDYAPTGWADATLVRLSGDSSCRAIRGFSAETSGEIKVLANVGSYPLYLAPEHASSTAANRIAYFEEVFLMPGQSCQVYYDGTLSRWVPFNVPNPGYCTPRKSVYYDQMPTKVPTAVSENFPLFIWGSIDISNTDPTSTIPFMAWDMNTGATTSGGSGIAYVRDQESMAYYGGAHIIAKAIIKSPATLGDATNNYYFFLRIANNPSSGFFTQNNSTGIYYRYSDNSGKWYLRTTDSGGTSTETDSGVTFAVDTEYELLVTINKARNEVTFFINGTVVGRHTTNLPSAAICAPSTQLEKTAGSSARSVYVYRFVGAAIAP